MHIFTIDAAPRYERDNIISHLLVSKGTCESDGLTITLVDIKPGGFQRPHSHENEQAYYILSGTSVMTIDGESKKVTAGDCVYIPSNARHGLKNSTDTALKYLSAASPSFTLEQCRSLWPLGPGI